MTQLTPQDIPDLESVISTAELRRRPSPAPDYAAENLALVALAQQTAVSPNGILQRLVETAMTLCRAHSAGISLLEDDRKRLRWIAIAGQWAGHLGGGTPRNFGPCGTVLDRSVPLLFSRPGCHFTYLARVTPFTDEELLIPVLRRRRSRRHDLGNRPRPDLPFRDGRPARDDQPGEFCGGGALARGLGS